MVQCTHNERLPVKSAFAWVLLSTYTGVIAQLDSLGEAAMYPAAALSQCGSYTSKCKNICKAPEAGGHAASPSAHLASSLSRRQSHNPCCISKPLQSCIMVLILNFMSAPLVQQALLLPIGPQGSHQHTSLRPQFAS